MIHFRISERKKTFQLRILYPVRYPLKEERVSQINKNWESLTPLDLTYKKF